MLRGAVPVVAAALAAALVGPGSATAQQGAQLADAPTGLPLVEHRAEPSATLALLMSGDGNWANFIRTVGDSLAAKGVGIVGLESRRYLSRPKTPDEVARDMEAVLRYYLEAWEADSVLIVGYSRGADFAPFVVNRLSPDLRARILAVALLSPTSMASFEFHFLDLVRFTPRTTDVPMLPEVEALAPIPVLCVFGADDKHSLCPLLPPGTAQILSQDTGHRLRDEGAIAREVLGLIGPR